MCQKTHLKTIKKFIPKHENNEAHHYICLRAIDEDEMITSLDSWKRYLREEYTVEKRKNNTSILDQNQRRVKRTVWSVIPSKNNQFKLKWSGYVTRQNVRNNILLVLKEDPDGKRPLERPRRRCLDNIFLNRRTLNICRSPKKNKMITQELHKNKKVAMNVKRHQNEFGATHSWSSVVPQGLLFWYLWHFLIHHILALTYYQSLILVFV